MKEKTFYLDTPSIRINQLSEQEEFKINFDLKNNDFIGVLKIRLDPDHIEWDSHYGEEFFQTECDRLIVSVTTNLEISDRQFVENTYMLAGEYLNIFFNYLQVELRQYWVDIGSILDWGLIAFLDKTISRQVVVVGEEKIHLPIGGYRTKINFSPKRRVFPEKSSGLGVKQIPDIEYWFEQHKEPELGNLLLANSKRLLLHNDYKLSAVLAITALEGPLESFVKQRCKIKGIPRERDTVGYDLSKLASILDTNELTNWLAEWLESTMHWHISTFDDNQIINWAIELNRARNAAIHEGELPKFDTLDKGIFAIEAIYEFVKVGN